MAAKKKAAKKKAATAAGTKSAHGSKGEFVRSLPSDLSAKEVVAKATAAGISLTDAYVYKIRSGSKSPKSAKATKSAASAPAAAKAGSAAGASAAEFVRALPAGTSAKDAVAKAKAAGVKLTEGYFYTLKSSLGLTGRGGAKAAPAAAPKGKPGRKPKAASAPSVDGLALVSRNPAEQAVIDAVRALGTTRARAIIDAVDRLQRG